MQNMKFLLDLAFAVELLAVGLGVAFLIWGYRNQGVGIALAKVTGYFITILAVIALLCSCAFGFKYWNDGHFNSPYPAWKTMFKQSPPDGRY